jgi:hypothetical protein
MKTTLTSTKLITKYEKELCLNLIVIIAEVNWIYGLPGSGKIEFVKDSLRIYDLMKKHDFIHTRLRSHKNIIYKNVTNNKTLKYMMKMFSGDPLIVKISYCHYNFLPTTIYVTCEFELKQFCSHYRIYVDKDGVVIYSSK